MQSLEIELDDPPSLSFTCAERILTFRKLLRYYVLLTIVIFLIAGSYSIAAGYGRTNGEYELSVPASDTGSDSDFVRVFSEGPLNLANQTAQARTAFSRLPLSSQAAPVGEICSQQRRPIIVRTIRPTGSDVGGSEFASWVILCIGALYAYFNVRKYLFDGFRHYIPSKEAKQHMEEEQANKSLLIKLWDKVWALIGAVASVISSVLIGFILSPTIVKCGELLLLIPPQWLNWAIGISFTAPGVLYVLVVNFRVLYESCLSKFTLPLFTLTNRFQLVVVVFVVPIVLFTEYRTLLEYGFVVSWESDNSFQARTIKLVSSYFLVFDVFIKFCNYLLSWRWPLEFNKASKPNIELFGWTK